jgi:HAMP domain-containing protein
MKVAIGVGVPLATIVMIAISLLVSAHEGSTQLANLLQRSREIEQIRGLGPHVVRVVAYAQIYSQGDRSFDQALVQQMHLIQGSLSRIRQSIQATSYRQEERIRQASHDWEATREAITELLRLSPDGVLQAPSGLMDRIAERSSGLQRDLELLEEAAQEDLNVIAYRATFWPGEFRVQAWLLVYSVVVLGGLIGLFVFWSILRPLIHLRRAAIALARGRPYNRMRQWPEDEFGSLAEALDALAKKKRRARSSA